MKCKIPILIAAILLCSVAFAHSDSVSILPPVHGAMEQFHIDITSSPQTILTDMTYVHSITILTTTAQNGPLLVREEPLGEGTLFSLTAPQSIEDDLIKATIQFWGADVPSLQIIHDHTGEDPYTVEAIRIVPDQTNFEGNVLWEITVPSFSDFYTQLPQKQKDFPILPALLIAFCALTGCFLVAKK